MQHPRALVRQGMHLLQRRDFDQAAGGQCQPLLAQAKQQQRAAAAGLLRRLALLVGFLGQRVTVQQARRCCRIDLAIAAVNMFVEQLATLVAMHTDTVPAVVDAGGVTGDQLHVVFTHHCSDSRSARRAARSCRRLAPATSP
ncbi:hypothetical protein D9M71_622250 [compost metagenome]